MDRESAKIFCFTMVLAVMIAAILEVGATAATRLLVARAWMAEIPHFSDAQITDALAARDPKLGWGPPPPRHGRPAVPRSRPDPAFPETSPPCASAYGDSFTVGGAADATYPHFLARILGCRVANFGVSGYGSDQALMLFRRQLTADHAPVCLLGHLSENILRNVNQFRNLIYPGPEMVFKPRFVERDGRLEVVPIPVNSIADYRAFESDPRDGLAFDAFADRPRRTFPYTLALLRWILTDFHVRAKITGKPRYEGFYYTDHPSGALRLTSKLLAAFADEARHNGQHPLVLLIPTGPDFLYARRTGQWTDQPLVEALHRHGVPVVHTGPAILQRLGKSDPCSLFTTCNGHFNARGYEALANVVAEAMERRGLLATIPRADSKQRARHGPVSAIP